MLEAEGVVEHTQNSGYAVVKLTTDEVAQAYVMRRVLETELIRSIRAVTPAEIAVLRELNLHMQEAFAEGEFASGLQLNKDFHFTMFSLAHLGIIEDHLRSVWTLSDPYRSIVIYDPETPARIAKEHGEMIDLLEGGLLDRLVEVLDRHREVGATRVLRTLQYLKRYGSQVVQG
jgi:DNA-binding GntR family transcriptional regulator